MNPPELKMIHLILKQTLFYKWQHLAAIKSPDDMQATKTQQSMLGKKTSTSCVCEDPRFIFVQAWGSVFTSPDVC